MSGLPPKREKQRGGVGGGREEVLNITFFGPSLHPLLKQRDRDDLTQMHWLSRAFADHVLPAHKSGSAHGTSFIGAIIMSKNKKNQTFNATLTSFQL